MTKRLLPGPDPNVKRLCADPDTVDALVKFNAHAVKEINRYQKNENVRKRKDKEITSMLNKLHSLVKELCDDREVLKIENEKLKEDNTKVKEELFHFKNIQTAMSGEMSLLQNEKDRLSLLCDAYKFSLQDICTSE